MKAAKAKTKAKADTIRFSPQGELSIYTAAEQKQELMLALEHGTSTEVDLSHVTMLDTAGLQLLVLARKEAQRRGKPLGFTGHSEAVIEVLDLCNLTAWFGDQVFIPSDAKPAGETP